MKKLLCIITLTAACYFAGMNNQPSIIAGVICIALVLIISLVFPRAIKGGINAEIPPQNKIIYKNTENKLSVRVNNLNRLPVSRISLYIDISYKENKKNRVRKKFRTSAAANGNTDTSVYFTAPYSGTIEASIYKIRIFDYLSLFSCSKKIKDSIIEIYVMPVPKKLNLIMPQFGFYTSNAAAESSSDKTGDDHSEIRQIREYRDGDLTKHIHRNYTAKTQKLWIKEYNKENDFIFDLIADTSDITLTPDILDAFFEIVFSIANTLADKDIIVNLHWYDRKLNGMQSISISSSETLEDAAAMLFSSDLRCTSQEFFNAQAADTENCMLINAKLEWYFLGQHVYSFNLPLIENELTVNIFDLRR